MSCSRMNERDAFLKVKRNTFSLKNTNDIYLNTEKVSDLSNVANQY